MKKAYLIVNELRPLINHWDSSKGKMIESYLIASILGDDSKCIQLQRNMTQQECARGNRENQGSQSYSFYRYGETVTNRYYDINMILSHGSHLFKNEFKEYDILLLRRHALGKSCRKGPMHVVAGPPEAKREELNKYYNRAVEIGWGKNDPKLMELINARWKDAIRQYELDVDFDISKSKVTPPPLPIIVPPTPKPVDTVSQTDPRYDLMARSQAFIDKTQHLVKPLEPHLL